VKPIGRVCCTEMKLAVDTVTQNTPVILTMPVPRCHLHRSGMTQRMEEVVGSRSSCIVGFMAVVEVAARQTSGMSAGKVQT